MQKTHVKVSSLLPNSNFVRIRNCHIFVKFKSTTQSVEHKNKNVFMSLLLFKGAFYFVHGAFKVENIY